MASIFRKRTIPFCLIALATALFFAGCQTAQPNTGNWFRARFVLESASPDGYAATVRLPVSQVQIALEAEASISEFDYTAIDVVDLELGKCLLFTLKPAASREFYRITVANQGKRLVLLMNGQPYGVRKIDGAVADGRIYIYIEATDEKMDTMAKQLKETNAEIQKTLSR